MTIPTFEKPETQYVFRFNTVPFAQKSFNYGIFESFNLLISSLIVTTIKSFCLFASSPIHQKCILLIFLYSNSGSLCSKLYGVKTAETGKKCIMRRWIWKWGKDGQWKKVGCYGILRFPKILKIVHFGYS